MVTIATDRGHAGQRLDLVLRRHLTNLRSPSRTRIQMWIEGGRVSVNHRIVRRASQRVPPSAVVTVTVDEQDKRQRLVPEAIPLDILHEDELCLAVNKPPGLIVHPSYKHPTGTLINALLWYARDWPRGERPSLVNRLDKFTSGVVIVARTQSAHRLLQTALGSLNGTKEYLALVYGRV